MIVINSCIIDHNFLCNTMIMNPIELEGEIHGTSNDDDTEVMDHKIGLGYWHHHSILFLKVRIHFHKVKICPTFEEYHGEQNGDNIKNKKQEKIGDSINQIICSLVVPVAVANVAKNWSILTRGCQEEASQITSNCIKTHKQFSIMLLYLRGRISSKTMFMVMSWKA